MCVVATYSGISCRDDDHTENKKELFQPQSANSALQADVWSSPSWSHLTHFKWKYPSLKDIQAHAGAHFSHWVQISPR